MRQVGVLAAAALYALRHHRDRLAQDHENARRFAAIVGESPHLETAPSLVETNVVHVAVSRESSADAVAAAALSHGVHVGVLDGGRIRAVFHGDVSRDEADRAARALIVAAASAAGGAS